MQLNIRKHSWFNGQSINFQYKFVNIKAALICYIKNCSYFLKKHYFLKIKSRKTKALKNQRFILQKTHLTVLLFNLIKLI